MLGKAERILARHSVKFSTLSVCTGERDASRVVDGEVRSVTVRTVSPQELDERMDITAESHPCGSCPSSSPVMEAPEEHMMGRMAQKGT